MQASKANDKQDLLSQNEVSRLAYPEGQTHLPQSCTGLTMNKLTYLCGVCYFSETPDAKLNTLCQDCRHHVGSAGPVGSTYCKIPDQMGTAPRLTQDRGRRQRPEEAREGRSG